MSPSLHCIKLLLAAVLLCAAATRALSVSTAHSLSRRSSHQLVPRVIRESFRKKAQEPTFPSGSQLHEGPSSDVREQAGPSGGLVESILNHQREHDRRAHLRRLNELNQPSSEEQRMGTSREQRYTSNRDW